MTQFEIIMRTDTPELPAEIGNFAEVKGAITEALKEYSTDAVVDANSVKDAEKTRAHLRKVKEHIESYRKDAKAAYLERFAVLETQCKELSGLIDKPITAIDTKIKEFENAEQEKKYAELQDFFDSLNSMKCVTLDRIINQKWRNKTATVEKLKTEINDSIVKIETEYQQLRGQYADSQLWTAIENRWAETLNLSQTLVYAAQLERQHAEEQKRAEAIQKAREEQALRENVQNAHTSAVEQGAYITPETPQSASDKAETRSESILRGTFTVECEKSKLIALVQFMKDNEIKYSVVKQ